MAQIYKLFSTKEPSPASHSLESANKLLPLVKRYTEEAIEESEKIATRLHMLEKGHPQYKRLSKRYDDSIMQWVERIHRLGALAKGLWLVDFDTGDGYLCWAYPEEKIAHFHSYDSGFKNRQRITEQEIKQI